MNYLELVRFCVPEIIVATTALLVLAVDLFTLRELEYRTRLSIGTMLAGVGCLVAIAWMLALPQSANLSEGMLVVSRLTQWVKVCLLVLTCFALLLSADTDFTEHVGEYLALILLAAVGMMFLVSAEDILMIFVALELTSLSLYVLAAFNKSSRASAEAALKYFLFGGVSSAFTLFGLSLLYGLSGATNLDRIAAALHAAPLDPLLALAIVMTLIGLGFKVAAAPFHLWAPDVYQGAPTPSAAFIASGSKLAGFFILARVTMAGFKGVEGGAGWDAAVPGWVPVVAAVAVISMLLGNLAALAQTSVRRLLAYSAIAHAGYILIGVVAHAGTSLAAVVYYAVTYALATLGAFGVVAAVERQTGRERLTDFAGLSRHAPLLSLCMMVFMLSLAGIPPLAGFFGKFYLFSAALGAGPQNLGLLWLVILALVMSAVSLYYYLKVLKQIYVADAAAGQTLPKPASPLLQATVAALALAVICLGCLPAWFVERLTDSIKLAGL
ncbi:MAG TPA: NADH-quinone oxidoreductase subunit N [Verrucomicrobiae bacterium]|nr:NADH-quinone oxidoreductase subunit N [Verrucomicrobiae bacterium]